MKKKFAFILMGPHYKPDIHKADFETDKQVTSIITVNDYDEALFKIKWLRKEGYGAVELCGAFGEDKTKEMIHLTDNEIAVGYVTHLKEQDDLFKNFFGK